MLATKVVCPFCSKRLKTKKPLGQGHRILCSRCDRSFLLGPETMIAPAVETEAPADPPPASPPPAPAAVEVHAVPANPPPLAPAAVEVPPAPPAPVPPPLPPVTVSLPPAPSVALPARLSRSPLLVTAACLALLLAAGGAVALCVRLAERKDDRQAQAAAPEVPASQTVPEKTPEAPREAEKPAPPEVRVPPMEPTPEIPLRLDEQPVPPPTPRLPPPAPRPEPPKLEPLPNPPPKQVAWLPPDEQEKVNKAIDRGVEYLKKTQQETGSWPGFGHPVGMAALPGLTLLECGVGPDDVRIRKAAAVVRSAGPLTQQTYELALSVLFLDRLGDPADRPLIQTLALRLVAGQSEAGGWTYQCPILGPAEERNLLAVLRHRQRPLEGEVAVNGRPGGPGGTVAGPAPGDLGKATSPGSSPSSAALPGSTIPLPPAAEPRPKPAPDPRPDAAAAKKALDSLPAPLRRIPALHEPPTLARAARFDTSDNSNTQFAILGVWVAGRHGVPTEKTLAHIARRFRLSQTADYGWGYTYSVPGNNRTPSMTGAGLLGLAVGLGLAVPEDAARDRKEAPPKDPAVEKGLRALAEVIGRPLGARMPGRGRPRWVGWGRPDVNLYFLWTLERVGVLYNLRHIDGKDWYQWGAEMLVDAQLADGAWTNGGYPGSTPDVDTCFALLFLKRSNFVQDLSRKLEFVIDVRSLRTGSMSPDR